MLDEEEPLNRVSFRGEAEESEAESRTWYDILRFFAAL